MSSLRHDEYSRTRLYALVAAVVLLFAGEHAMSLEQPTYTVLYKDGKIEYRQYDAYLVSETVVANFDSYNAAANEGFRRLFRYITGANQGKRDVAMTAPVVQQPGEKIAMTAPVQQNAAANGWRISFMLPAEFTLETAPVPTDARVVIRQVPGRLMAVYRYSGRWTEKNFLRYQEGLRRALEGESIKPLGEMQSALYNAPFTPPFMRRNEIMVAIDRLPAAVEEPAVRRLAAQ